MISITLYTTAGCHLCELADAMLHELPTHQKIIVTPVEIGDDDELVERYGTSIPVIQFEDDSTLNWPFTQQDIERKLN